MKYALPVLLLAAVAALPQAALAQTKPDFSGTWVMDPSRSESAVQNEPVKSMTMVITQSPTDLTVVTTRDGRKQTVTYRPGSPDSLNSSTGRPSLISSAWYWEGPRLVAEALTDVNGTTVRSKVIHALNAAGQEMTVETLVIVEHGYTLRGAKNYGAGKDVFKKATP